MRPVASVVVPAHQVTAFIAETLDSVLAQTRQDFEIVVVNDGCPDTVNLERVLRPYRHRIVYVVQPASGPSKARNTGIASARGEYVAFLDGDDLWAPEFLATQLAMLEADPGLVLVYCDSRPFGVIDGAPISLMAQNPDPGACDLAAVLSGRAVVITSTTVARRRAVIEAGGFDERLRRCEDFDLWLRLAGKGRFACNRRVLGGRRLHGGSLSSSPTAMLEAQIDVRRRFVAGLPDGDPLQALARETDRRCAAEIALFEGRRLLRDGQVAAARRELARAAEGIMSWKLAATRGLLSLAPRTAVAVARWRR